MSNLEGNLTPRAFQGILDILIDKNPPSTLLVSDGRDEKVVYFSTGGIRIYSSDGRRFSSLEDFLVRRDLINSDQLLIALDLLKEGRRETLDEILERKEYLPRSKYLSAVSELIAIEISDMVTWENAIYEHYEGNPPPEIFDQNHPAVFTSLDIKKLASQIKEWSQEWEALKAKVYSERLRPKLLAPGLKLVDQADTPQSLRRIYCLMDGQRTLKEISRLSGIDFLETARAVRDGLKEAHLRATLVPEKESSSQEEVMSEIERLEEALEKAINTILIHKRIATGYEKIDDAPRASEHYQAIGDLHSQAGRVANALVNYRKAIQISPQNLAAHEVLIRRLQEQGREDEALKEIVDLSRKMLSFGLPERALETLRAIKTKVTGLFDLRRLIAETLTTLGRITEAVTEYLGMARDMKRMGVTEGIEEVYRRILALDPTNQEARSGLFQDVKRRVGKKVVWFHRITGAAACLLLLLWVTNEVLAWGTWRTERAEIWDSLAGGAAREGMERIWEAGNAFPGSLLAWKLIQDESRYFIDAFNRVEGDLEKSKTLQSDGKIKEARKLLNTVAESGLLSSQAMRARQRNQELESELREVADLRRLAKVYLDQRNYENAFFVCRKILDRYRGMTDGVEIPFYISTEPVGADVRIGGVRWGSAPMWVILDFGSLQEVRVEKPGFSPKVIQWFESRRSPFINVDLRD